MLFRVFSGFRYEILCDIGPKRKLNGVRKEKPPTEGAMSRVRGLEQSGMGIGYQEKMEGVQWFC